VKQFGIRRPVIVQDATSFSFTLAESVRSELAKTKHPALAVFGITQGARTYAPSVKKIINSGADAVFYTGYYAEAGILVRDLRAAGFDGKVILGDGSADLAILDAASQKDLKNVYFITPPMPSITVSAQDWIKRFRDFSGAAPRAFSMQSYTAVMAVVEAIKRVGGTDSLKIAQALRSAPIATPYGEVRFDERQVASTAFALVTIANGAFKEACLSQCS
jgi:branched-chain amino acid transport system substrate-binding protein